MYAHIHTYSTCKTLATRTRRKIAQKKKAQNSKTKTCRILTTHVPHNCRPLQFVKRPCATLYTCVCMRVCVGGWVSVGVGARVGACVSVFVSCVHVCGCPLANVCKISHTYVSVIL